MPLRDLSSWNDNYVKKWSQSLLTPDKSLEIDGAQGASYRLCDTHPWVQCAGDTWPCAASVTDNGK